MQETKRITRREAKSRRRPSKCEANDEEFDWENALVASDSASISASASVSASASSVHHNTLDRPKENEPSGALSNYLGKTSCDLSTTAAISSATSSEDSRSQSTGDSDKAKSVPVQLMRIAEEPDDDIVFERSFHSPRTRPFSDILATVSPNNVLFKPKSPAKSLSRFPFEEVSLGEGNSRSSYQEEEDDDDTEQATEIAGNLSSMKRMKSESMDPQEIFDGLQGSMTETDSEPRKMDILSSLQELATVMEPGTNDQEIFSGICESTVGERVTVEKSTKECLSQTFPEWSAVHLSPTHLSMEAKRKSDKHRELSVPVGSADSTAPLESFDHSEKKRGCPQWFVLAWVIFAVVALAVSIGFIVVARMTIIDESSRQELSPENSEDYAAKIMHDVAISVSGPDSLTDINSPQFKALGWLTTVDTDVGTQSLELMAERYIATLIYFATGGEAWDLRHNFLSGGTICNWNEVNSSTDVPHGIVCDDQLKVKQIVLVENNVGGTIPWEIALLDSLEALNLSRNYIRGEIPSRLGQLRKLRDMKLDSNILTGPLPSTIGSNTGLMTLNLASNRLTGSLPSEIGNLVNLERLILGNNKLHGSIPKSLWKMTRLIELNIFRNEFSGAIPKGIGGLPRMEKLNFASNEFVGDLNENFCSPGGQEYESFWADCRGDSPLVHCSCCTICCEQIGGSLVC